MKATKLTKATRPAHPTRRLLTVKEAADLLSIHPNTVRRWADEGILPAFRMGRRGDRRFQRSDIYKLVSVRPS